MNWHGASLLALFCTGLGLLYLCSEWYVQDSPHSGTAVLGVAGCCSMLLSLLGHGSRREGAMAASIVSAFWTVAAGVAFAMEAHVLEAKVLLLSSLVQVVSALLGGGMSTSKACESEHIKIMSSPHQPSTRNYGALSSFVDPLYMPVSTRAASGSQTSQSSPSANRVVAEGTPSSSPQQAPSPFGANPSTQIANLSAAAAQSSKQVGETYRLLWDKHDLA